jgi:predicted AlkP superfamily phosphohydrolase/phosphomutase
MTGKKTLLVGLDAACWEYLQPLLDRGRLPTLQGLMRTGASGVLMSTMPPWTPTAWASIITGKNPGRHGVFDMMWRRPNTYEFVPTNSEMRIGAPFWTYLEQSGLRVGLVNVPYTYPPEAVRGFLVAGFGASRSAEELTYPRNLMASLGPGYEGYRPVVDTDVLRHGTAEEILRMERDHQARQVETALEAAARLPVDVLAINLMLLDHANHKMADMEMVSQAIEYCDSDLARLIQSYQPDNVMVISDHGSRRIKGRFLLHAWLTDHGYQSQVPRTWREQSEALNWLLAQWLPAVRGWTGGREKLARGLLRQSLLRMPKAFRGGLWRALTSAIPFAEKYIQESEVVDYARSVVFPGSIYSGLLYFNVNGRDPAGVLRGDERASLAAELRGALEALRDPDSDEPLFPRVYEAAELYQGPYLDQAPDLIIDSYSGDWNIQTGRYTPTVEQPRNRYFLGNQREHGWHSREGIYVFSGQDFASRPTGGREDVLDIPATLLHLHGVAVPSDFDGRVLTEKLHADLLRDRPVTYQPAMAAGLRLGQDAYSAEEVDEITDHLRALGYIE